MLPKAVKTVILLVSFGVTGVTMVSLVQQQACLTDTDSRQMICSCDEELREYSLPIRLLSFIREVGKQVSEKF